MTGARHAYPNARLTVLASRLLAPADVERLVEGSGPPPATSAPGQIVAAALADPAVASRNVEHALLSDLLRDFLVVTRPLEGTARELVVHGLHRFELANIKSIIRAKFAGIPAQAMREQLVDLRPFATLPIDELLGTEDAAEFLRRLERTPYAEIARHARHVLEEQHDLFSVEAAIDRRYYLGLRHRALIVPGAERQAVIGLVGVVLDQLALVSLLRYRFAYELSAAKTYYLLVPSPGTMSDERLRSLVQLGSISEVLGALPPAAKHWLGTAATAVEVEDALERRTCNAALAALRDTRAPTARSFAYLILRDDERRRVLAVFKGRRLGFEPALIRHAARLAA